MANNQVSLSVVLPAYNPPTGWKEQVISSYKKILQEIPDAELIIVNDGSKNLDLQELNSIQTFFKDFIPVSYTENKGKGYALREGVKRANGDLIIYTDIDFPYTHESLMNLFTELKSGKQDLLVGIRSEEYYTHLPKARVRISKILRWFIKKFLRIPTNDTQCGLKGFNQAGKTVFMQTTINRYLFDLEFIFLSARKKLAIKTVEVELKPGIVLSSMNWKILLQEFINFLKIFVQSFF
ncbi:MAG: glycosyltransferase family 2 protein [Chitinophagales bacterium]|nr:glycosyltransferase family 2 protein [Chitinophagales bacterium]